MRPPALLLALLVTVPLVLAAPSSAATMGAPDVAAVQVALFGRALYPGPIDGVVGPDTTKALKQLQRKHGLPVTGVADPATLDALGGSGETLGSRELSPGMSGFDVAELQFLLAWHGFPNGPFDGKFGAHVERALADFRVWAGEPADGGVDEATVSALQAPVPSCPIALAWPLDLPVGSPFGPRGNGFHPGIDIPADTGTPVAAAAAGVVVTAGFQPDGYGRRVVISHGHGVTSIYAHLSKVEAHVGDQLSAGDELGLVGATGQATGPHLHFEVRVRGAAVDPLPALP